VSNGTGLESAPPPGSVSIGVCHSVWPVTSFRAISIEALVAVTPMYTTPLAIAGDPTMPAPAAIELPESLVTVFCHTTLPVSAFSA